MRAIIVDLDGDARGTGWSTGDASRAASRRLGCGVSPPPKSTTIAATRRHDAEPPRSRRRLVRDRARRTGGRHERLRLLKAQLVDLGSGSTAAVRLEVRRQSAGSAAGADLGSSDVVDARPSGSGRGSVVAQAQPRWLRRPASARSAIGSARSSTGWLGSAGSRDLGCGRAPLAMLTCVRYECAARPGGRSYRLVSRRRDRNADVRDRRFAEQSRPQFAKLGELGHREDARRGRRSPGWQHPLGGRSPPADERSLCPSVRRSLCRGSSAVHLRWSRLRIVTPGAFIGGPEQALVRG